MVETPQAEMTEQSPIALEIEAIQGLIADLERMVAMWEHDKLEVPGWRSLSGEWNARRIQFCAKLAKCQDRSMAHRHAHLAAVHLGDAWQRIHRRVIAGRAPDLSGLQETKRRLAEAAQAARWAGKRESTTEHTESTERQEPCTP